VCGSHTSDNLRQILGIQDNLDSPVGGSSLVRLVRRDRAGVRVADRGELLAVDTALIDQIANDDRGAGSRQLPVCLEAILQLRADRHVVCVAFDPDLLVCNCFQHVADLFQDLESGRLDFRPAGIEQDAIDHVDGQFVANLLNRNIALRDFVLVLQNMYARPYRLRRKKGAV